MHCTVVHIPMRIRVVVLVVVDLIVCPFLHVHECIKCMTYVQ